MIETMPDDPAPLPPSAPIAARRPLERLHHGRAFVDHYDWLRDKDDPETLRYLEAENSHTAAKTAHLADLREAIFTEIKTRTQETDLSVPARTGRYWHYSRTVENEQYPLLCRLPIADDGDWTPPELVPGTAVQGEEVLLDCNQIAEGHDFFELGDFTVSLDDELLAFAVDIVGDERYTVRIKNLLSGELLPDQIDNTLHGLAWSADGSFLFYTTVDAAWRPDKVWRHPVGADASTDVLVYEETNSRFWTTVGRTTSDRYLVISSGSRITSEHRILEADDPTGEFRVVVERADGVEYDVDHAVVQDDDRLVVLHNRGAENFALGIGPVSLASLEDLTAIIPASAGIRLSTFSISSTTLAVGLREDGLAKVRTFSLGPDGIGPGVDVGVDEELYALAAHGFADWRQPLVRLTYSSWVTPQTVIDYNPSTAERQVRKRQAVLGGYEPSDYVQTREWVRASDGALVPISIVHRQGVEPRSGAPLLLYGYGSYELSMDPFLSIARLSLLDRGMVFVLAHVRGGGEMGRHWYEQGKQLTKKNTFTDFVACAQHLIDTGWTSPDRLVALGGSAGGLLMGAVANLAPELFVGIVAQVPFVDPLTSILDPSLPLTVIEWDEWGDPLHDPMVYDYLASYSPYECVEAQHYPAIYALTSLHDTRVLYVEAAKWVAQLRKWATGERPLLLKCEMSAGHGGVSGRYDAWREAADYYAWILDTAGAPREARQPVSASDQGY
ncbi:MAG: S9 family peptidase [Nocardioidaceae bacterium]